MYLLDVRLVSSPDMLSSVFIEFAETKRTRYPLSQDKEMQSQVLNWKSLKAFTHMMRPEAIHIHC